MSGGGALGLCACGHVVIGDHVGARLLGGGPPLVHGVADLRTLGLDEVVDVLAELLAGLRKISPSAAPMSPPMTTPARKLPNPESFMSGMRPLAFPTILPAPPPLVADRR